MRLTSLRPMRDRATPTVPALPKAVSNTIGQGREQVCRRWRSAVSAALIVLMLTVSDGTAVAGEPLVGRARVVDGQTLEIGRIRVPLLGIVAPLPDQMCIAGNRRWGCGHNASFALAQIVGHHWVHCRAAGRDASRPDARICHLAGSDGADIGAEMVRQGWAFADPSVPGVYAAEEERARRTKAGLWTVRFDPPWPRRRN